MKKPIVMLILFCLLLTGCKKVVQKIPIDACTIPAHVEYDSYGTGDDKKYYSERIPTTYYICYRRVFDNDTNDIKWEEVGKDEYNNYMEENK